MRGLSLLFVSFILGCGSSESASDPASDASPAGDGSSEVSADGATDAADSATDSATSCPRAPMAEGPRKIVVSHPFDTAGKKTGAMEVLDLSADGKVTKSGKTFALTKAAFEPIVFTPDGALGFVAEDDGTIGVFRADGTVVNAAFKGSFYAGKLVVDPSGGRLWVVDSNTEENGGGLYAVDIGCDGALTEKGKVVAAKTPQVMQFLTDARVLFAGGPALGSAATDDAHLVAWGAKPSLLGSGAPFGDRDAIPSWIAVTPDQKLALIADNGILAGSRLAVVELGEATVKPLQVLTLDNPAVVLASPFGNAALVCNSDGKDGYTLLKKTGPATAPFVSAGKLTYVNGKPELPSVAAMIARGPLQGRVLVAENLAVRTLQFNADGTITDVAKLTYGSGLENIVGSIGVQP